MRTVDKKITDLIEKYHKVDMKFKKLKDQRSGLSDLLKDVLKERGNIIETGEYRASLIVRTNISRFDKPKLRKDYGVDFIEKYTSRDGTREELTTEKRGA